MIVVDRGYYSQESLIKLGNQGYRFLAGAKTGYKLVKSIIEESGFYKEKWHAFRPKLNASLQTLHTIESLKDERTSFKLDGFSFSREQ